MAGEVVIQLTVNGEIREVRCRPDSTLLEVLRDELGLLGTKFGCGIGYCGACTVVVDGRAAHSCCLLAGTLDGVSVTTVEGIAVDGELQPVQEAFLDCGAVQCGFCTSGFVMSISALLEENPDPTEADVRNFLVGNICRCTGYTKIVEAAMAAARGRIGASE
jgi:aerobic carbon-monoxide dehydrogenase small subunit